MIYHFFSYSYSVLSLFFKEGHMEEQASFNILIVCLNCVFIGLPYVCIFLDMSSFSDPKFPSRLIL